jgi:hypothetical protein
MIPALASLHTGRLGLTPTDPLQIVDPARITREFSECGFIGEPLPERTDGYAIGVAFETMIGFTGCAVQFDDGSGGASGGTNGPWVRVPQPARAPELHVGRNTRPPRCPACRAALRDWRDQVSEPTTTNALEAAALRLQCRSCGAGPQAIDWDWGRHGGTGRSFVWVEEVFPAEAAPLPGLLSLLSTLGAGDWKHFYVQD